MGHSKQHSFTASTEHDFTGLNTYEVLLYDGTSLTSATPSVLGIATGTGVSDYLVKWDSTGAGLSSSTIYESGGNVVFNEDGLSGLTIRMESDTNPNHFYVDTTNDNFGFGIQSNANYKAYMSFASEARTIGFYIDGTSIPNANTALQVNAGTTTSTSTGVLGIAASTGNISRGIYGSTTSTNSSHNYALAANARNGSTRTAAVFAEVTGESVSPSSGSYGVFVNQASGVATQKYGIYSTISGNATGTTYGYRGFIADAGSDSTIYGAHNVTNISTGSRTGLTVTANYIQAYGANMSANTFYGLVVVPNASVTPNSGFGTASPAETVHVVGDLRLENSSYGTDKIAVSDASGTISFSGATDIGLPAKFAGSSAFTASVALQVDHNLGTTDVLVQLKNASGELVIPDVVDNYQANSVDITVSTTATYRVIIIG